MSVSTDCPENKENYVRDWNGLDDERANPVTDAHGFTFSSAHNALVA